MIEIRPAGKRVRVVFNDEVIAESRDALVLKEGKYPPVYYLPRKDVKMERLIRTSHTSHCPHKEAGATGRRRSSTLSRPFPPSSGKPPEQAIATSLRSLQRPPPAQRQAGDGTLPAPA